MSHPSARVEDMEERNRIYAKVRALLAKAESTDYPEEAAVYTAKVHQMLSMHQWWLALPPGATSR